MDEHYVTTGIEVGPELTQSQRELLATDTAGLPPRERALVRERQVALLTSIIQACSRGAAVQPYLEAITEQIQAAVEPDGRILSLAMTIASAPINRAPFSVAAVAATRALVEAIGAALTRLGEERCEEWASIGTAIDIWSQASGISIQNPTGRWHMQVDALHRGWRKPRLGRAYWTTTEFPSLREYAQAILGGVPDAERGVCLAALVREGMNQDLAFEIAAYLDPVIERELREQLQRPAPEAGYPPLVRQALNLSRSVMKLTHNLVTGRDLTVSGAEQEDRLRLCRDCDAFVAASRRCRVCGCYLSAKLRFVTEHCPRGHW